MVLGSFTLSFLVEHRRLQRADSAAHIARGAVWARLWILLLKVVVTVGMSAYLLIGFWLD